MNAPRAPDTRFWQCWETLRRSHVTFSFNYNFIYLNLRTVLVLQAQFIKFIQLGSLVEVPTVRLEVVVVQKCLT